MRLVSSLLVLFLLAVVGCTAELPPTSALEVGDAESVSSAKVGDAPSVSGIIVRDEAPLGVTWVDVKRGLRVVLGADMDEYCNGIVDFDVISYQSATLPNADAAIVRIGQGTVQATVWSFLDFDCALFTTEAPVASGYADVVSTDNDVEGNDGDDVSANAWGWQAHGTLTDPGGERVQFSGFVRQVVSYAGGNHVTSRILLH